LTSAKGPRAQGGIANPIILHTSERCTLPLAFAGRDVAFITFQRVEKLERRVLGFVNPRTKKEGRVWKMLRRKRKE
jgi:hypothetical protein